MQRRAKHRLAAQRRIGEAGAEAGEIVRVHSSPSSCIGAAGFACDREELDLAALRTGMAPCALQCEMAAHRHEQLRVQHGLLRGVLQQRIGHGGQLRMAVRAAQHVGNADRSTRIAQSQRATRHRDLAHVEALAGAAGTALHHHEPGLGRTQPVRHVHCACAPSAGSSSSSGARASAAIHCARSSGRSESVPCQKHET
jgi:hypothetical protein